MKCSAWAELHAYRCWMTSMRSTTSIAVEGAARNRCVWPASAEIGFHMRKQLIVFKQSIQFGQLRLKPQLKSGYQREEVH